MIFLLEPLNGHEEVLKDDSRCDQSIRSGEFCPDTNFEDNPTTLKRSRANLDLCHAWGLVMVPLKKISLYTVLGGRILTNLYEIN